MVVPALIAFVAPCLKSRLLPCVCVDGWAQKRHLHALACFVRAQLTDPCRNLDKLFPGMLNTDNLSVLGLSLDHGSFSFMDHYDPRFAGHGKERSWHDVGACGGSRGRSGVRPRAELFMISSSSWSCVAVVYRYFHAVCPSMVAVALSGVCVF